MSQISNVVLPFYGPHDHTREVRDRIDTLNEEIGTGQVSDLGRALGSDFSQASQFAHSLRTLDGFSASLDSARTWGEALQNSLGQIADASSRLAGALPTSIASLDRPGLALTAQTARGTAEDIGIALNRAVAGRALFANGAEGGGFLSVDAVLADVAALAASSTEFDGYVQAVDAYFADGGVFETAHLSDVTGGHVRFPASPGERVSFEVDAGQSELRAALAQAALVAGLPNAGFSIPSGQKSSVVADLLGRSVEVGSGLAWLQGQVGLTEGRVETLADQTSRERGSAEVALSDLMEADPFETATRLQNEMSRLETLYAITARRARLRLTDYL